jgi:hypothetical protein
MGGQSLSKHIEGKADKDEGQGGGTGRVKQSLEAGCMPEGLSIKCASRSLPLTGTGTLVSHTKSLLSDHCLWQKEYLTGGKRKSCQVPQPIRSPPT